jgi:hypothetical protein
MPLCGEKKERKERRKEGREGGWKGGRDDGERIILISFL